MTTINQLSNPSQIRETVEKLAPILKGDTSIENLIDVVDKNNDGLVNDDDLKAINQGLSNNKLDARELGTLASYLQKMGWASYHVEIQPAEVHTAHITPDGSLSLPAGLQELGIRFSVKPTISNPTGERTLRFPLLQGNDTIKGDYQSINTIFPNPITGTNILSGFTDVKVIIQNEASPTPKVDIVLTASNGDVMELTLDFSNNTGSYAEYKHLGEGRMQQVSNIPDATLTPIATPQGLIDKVLGD